MIFRSLFLRRMMKIRENLPIFSCKILYKRTINRYNISQKNQGRRSLPEKIAACSNKFLKDCT